MVVPLFPLIGYYLRNIEEKMKSPPALYYGTIAAVTLYVAVMLVKFGPYS